MARTHALTWSTLSITKDSLSSFSSFTYVMPFPEPFPRPETLAMPKREPMWTRMTVDSIVAYMERSKTAPVRLTLDASLLQWSSLLDIDEMMSIVSKLSGEEECAT